MSSKRFEGNDERSKDVPIMRFFFLLKNSFLCMFTFRFHFVSYLYFYILFE